MLPDAEHFGKTGDVRMAGWLVGRVGDRRLQVLPTARRARCWS